MTLHSKLLTEEMADFELANHLNKEAFPEEERIPLVKLLDWAREQDEVFLLGFYDDQLFLGFAYLRITDELIYIGFFAIRSDIRGHGYGGQIIQHIKERFANRPIIVEIERLDEPCDNFQQRQARWSFYERNGFSPSGYYLNYDGLSFEVLYAGAYFPLAAYDKMFRMASANFSYEIIPKAVEK